MIPLDVLELGADDLAQAWQHRGRDAEGSPPGLTG
jgi:hypothetical protein